MDKNDPETQSVDVSVIGNFKMEGIFQKTALDSVRVMQMLLHRPLAGGSRADRVAPLRPQGQRRPRRTTIAWPSWSAREEQKPVCRHHVLIMCNILFDYKNEALWGVSRSLTAGNIIVSTPCTRDPRFREVNPS